MTNILDIYKLYKLPHSLVVHQLRTAAVAKLICDNLNNPIDEQSVVMACLLHDMGNIIKFDFEFAMKNFPKEFTPQNIDIWRQVQADYAKRYGTADAANTKIAKELDVSQQVIDLIGSVAFPKISHLQRHGTIEQQLVEYSDMRVSPTGVVSITERTNEGRLRYSARKDRDAYDFEGFDDLVKDLRLIEERLFANSKIKPNDITNTTVRPIIEQLKSYEIQNKQI